MTFAESLKMQRHYSGFTQHELGIASSIQTSQISALERGVQLPGYNTIVDLCKGLGCEPNDLIEVTYE